MLERTRLLPLLVLISCALPAFLSAQTPGEPRPALPPNAVPADATVGPIKLGDVTVDAALELLERWSGRTVLRPSGLPTTSLSFTLNQKVTREEARMALESLLTLNGIAVTPLGEKFLKVTPLAAARTEAPDFIEGSTLGLPPSGHIASKLFVLQFLRVADFGQQIASVLNAGAAGTPVVFEKANAFLLTDSVSNLQRVETLLARVDQPSFQGLVPKFYKIRNSTASSLVTRLQNLLSGNAGTPIGANTSYQADDRTNQIILLSDPRQHAFFDNLIGQLDTPSESSTRQEVIPLKHATATEVATLLSSLITGQNSATAKTGTAQVANPQLNAALQAVANARPNTPEGNARPATPPASAAVTAANAAASQQFSGILTVVADERSNALVVSGTVDDLQLIRAIVNQLDVILAQVRIEVVIAEITLTDAASTGIDSLGLVIEANRLVGFSGSAAGITATKGTLVDTSGNRSLAATLALTATPRKSTINILQNPNIVTTHNKEATIFVGESRPVITSYQNTNVSTSIGSGYTSNVTYKDIGIRLTVKPLIGNDGSVQLDVKQQVDDILDSVTIDGNAQPVIGSRTTESFVSVRSGEIVVLGGLQRKSQSRSTSRLAGIPLIGDLLGSREHQTVRNDLVFFLRPYVLTNTAADNAEALARLKDSPQEKEVQSLLSGEKLPAKP